MKRFLGSLFVIAGVLSVGLMDARAAEVPPQSQQQLIMLAESEQSSEQFAREQVIITASPELLQTPFFQSLFSSYVQIDLPVSATTPVRVSDTDKNRRAPEPAVRTNESNPIDRGADGVRATPERSGVGTTGGRVPLSGPTTLKLTELYPNTTDDDTTAEYITLKNTG